MLTLEPQQHADCAESALDDFTWARGSGASFIDMPNADRVQEIAWLVQGLRLLADRKGLAWADVERLAGGPL